MTTILMSKVRNPQESQRVAKQMMSQMSQMSQMSYNVTTCHKNVTEKILIYHMPHKQVEIHKTV